MQSIRNDDTSAAIKQWITEGSDLNRPLTIDFFVAMPSEIACKHFCEIDELADFNIMFEKDEETSGWTCYCTKTLIPDYDQIVSIENQLDSIAKKYDGYADGFGSYGNVKDS
ncbi:MAG: ribonuclease E inhibitor RraB [Methyloglobulus sp.]|nr:ribonuclease E inhibitor RraB [Methyloglobulus sp.]